MAGYYEREISENPVYQELSIKGVKMKRNQSFWSQTVLIVTLLASTTLSTQAEEVTKYGRDQSNQRDERVLVAAANSQKNDHGAKSTDPGFIVQSTTIVEFTIATLLVIGGLIISDRYQGNQEQQARTTEESKEKELAIHN